MSLEEPDSKDGLVLKLGGIYKKVVMGVTYYSVMTAVKVMPNGIMAGELKAHGAFVNLVTADGQITEGWEHVVGGTPISKLG
jgi:hypothetical protein